MRLLFAKVLSGHRTAFVFDMDNKVVGGIGYVTEVRNDYGNVSLKRAFNRENIHRTQLTISWEWNKTCEPADFESEFALTLGAELDGITTIEHDK